MEIIQQAPYSVTEDMLEPLLENHETGSIELLEAIVEKNVLPREIACKVWGDSIGVAYVEPITTIINRDAMELIPVEIATKARALVVNDCSAILVPRYSRHANSRHPATRVSSSHDR